jgi:lipooligosaccharide transport system ATP-binding protein
VEGSPSQLIAEHAGKEVVEIRLVAGESKESCLNSLGEAVPVGAVVECSEDTVYLYSDDAAAILSHVTADSDRTVLHRRASLEDVFLRLTGRELRE